jgi:glycosyltransferase involved in cell wall biosynthesis
MSLLLVDLGNEWRGGQNQAFLLLQGFKSVGAKPELLTVNGSLLGERAAAEGILVHSVPVWNRQISGGLKLRTLLLSNRISMIHANEPHAVSAVWLGGVHKKVPYFISRRVEFPIPDNFIAQARYRAADCIIANTNWVAKHLLASKMDPSRVRVVYEGTEIPPEVTNESRIAAKRSWGVAEDEFLFGCPSAFVPEKGQKHLVKALALVIKSFPKSKLLLAGEGKCRVELESLSTELGLESNVIFPGFVNEMERFYSALDVFLFPSEIEGLGSALPEAMAYGLACISTASGGLAEIVENGKTALVVQPDAKEFGAAMMDMLRDEALRKKLGHMARREALHRFSSMRMVNATNEVYREVLRTIPTRNGRK